MKEYPFEFFGRGVFVHYEIFCVDHIEADCTCVK